MFSRTHLTQTWRPIMTFTTPGTLTIHSWLAGNISTSELDNILSDSETMRALRDDHVEELLDRYGAFAGRPINNPVMGLPEALRKRVAHIDRDHELSLYEWIKWVTS